MQMEEVAGLGFGVSVLLLTSLAASVFGKGRTVPGAKRGFDALYSWAIVLSAFIGLLVFATKTGASGPVRHATPYYALLIPALLMTGSQVRLVGARWWRWVALGNFALAGLVVILSPARPLWPALTVLRSLGADRSEQRLAQRAWTVYSVYRQRPDAFEPVRRRLPGEANPVGLVTSDDPESALWRPYGSRRILHVCRGDTPEQTRQRGIKYVVVGGEELTQNQKISFQAWLKANDAEVIEPFRLRLRAAREPSDWWVVKLR
jgi:hypothetical protein